jgi:hypothetical protein
MKALLYHFDGDGECVGGTWHRGVAEAKESAAAEYAGLAHDWLEIPASVDISTFGAALRGEKLESPARPAFISCSKRFAKISANVVRLFATYERISVT